jgi:hypothetical protein
LSPTLPLSGLRCAGPAWLRICWFTPAHLCRKGCCAGSRRWSGRLRPRVRPRCAGWWPPWVHALSLRHAPRILVRVHPQAHSFLHAMRQWLVLSHWQSLPGLSGMLLPPLHGCFGSHECHGLCGLLGALYPLPVRASAWPPCTLACCACNRCVCWLVTTGASPLMPYHVAGTYLSARLQNAAALNQDLSNPLWRRLAVQSGGKAGHCAT